MIDYTAIKNDISFGLSDSKNIYYSLMYQLTHITKERDSIVHDDRLDGLTLGVQYWNDYGILKQNSDDALKQYHKKQINEELKRRANIFRSNNMGGVGSGNTKPSLGRFRGYKR